MPRARLTFATRPSSPRRDGRRDRRPATAPALLDLLTAHVEAGITGVRLHTADLMFCDAAGIRVLVAVSRRLAARGGSFEVLDAPPHLRRLLAITDLEHLLASPPCSPSVGSGREGT